MNSALHGEGGVKVAEETDDMGVKAEETDRKTE